MRIEDFITSYPPISDKNFQYELARKKEFYDLKLDKYGITKVGNNLAYQTIIERFFGDHTDFDSLLLFHEMGLGKTRSAILAAEANKPQKSTLVLANSDTLLNNFKGELISYDKKFAPIDERGRLIDPRKQADKYEKRLNKAVAKGGYKMTLGGGKKTTLEIFAKHLEEMSDEEIIAKYSNHVIIIDEAHMLKFKEVKNPKEPNPGKKKTKHGSQMKYKQIHRLTHLVQDSKILLLTGTPIWDDVDEIATLLNLILPLDKQLSTKFKKDYLGQDGNILESKTSELVKKLSGRISFLKQTEFEIKKNIMGKSSPFLQYNKIVMSAMSKIQYRGWMESRGKEISEERLEEHLEEELSELSGEESGGRLGLREQEFQACNFTFEYDKKLYYGKSLFTNFVRQKKGPGGPTFILDERLKSALRDKDGNYSLELLRKYSCKFAEIIKNILDHPDELSFVFSIDVTGSGAVLFGLILELFGYSRSMGQQTTKLSYGIITHLTESHKSDIIKTFNSPENKHGKFIHVLIGSKTISVGITLKNVMHTHVLRPFWHMSILDQAIARTIRFGSHADLGPKYNYVNIYQHAATEGKNPDVVDVAAYVTAEEKDLASKKIYRFLAKIAMDCPLTYKKNVNPTATPGTRECDYQECNYQCFQMKPTGETGGVYDYDIAPVDLDSANYNLLYSQNEVKNSMANIAKFFATSFQATLQELSSIVKTSSIEILLQALNILISKKLAILDKYGIPCYLREQSNLYYLDPTTSSKYDVRSAYYVQVPYLRQPMDMQDVLMTIKFESEIKTIPNFCDMTKKSDIDQYIDNMDYRAKIILLEVFFQAYQLDQVAKDKEKLNAIALAKLAPYIYEIENAQVLENVLTVLLSFVDKERIKFKTIQDRWIQVRAMLEYFGYPTSTNNEASYSLAALGQAIRDKKKPLIVQILKRMISDIPKYTKGKEYVSVHTMYSYEPTKTGYKQYAKATGKTRYFDGKEWKYVPSFLEEPYIEFVKGIEKQVESKGIKDNPYGIYGTDDGKTFKFYQDTKGKVTGLACGTGQKSRVISALLHIYEMEQSIGEESEFNIDYEDWIEEMGRDELLGRIEAYVAETSGTKQFGKSADLKKLDDEALKFRLYVLRGDYRKDLCPLLKKWLKTKGLLYNI